MKKLLLISMVLFSQFSYSAGVVYMQTIGSTQGRIKGDNLSKGHEDSSVLKGVNFEVLVPNVNGQPSGKRQLKPLTVLKEWGTASVHYYTAFATNELLKEVKITYFVSGPASPNGTETLVKTITLGGATITDIKNSYTSDPVVDAEEITFNYQKISITDSKGNVYEDSTIN
jgi:type VI secretion system secreted protein Hcp